MEKYDVALSFAGEDRKYAEELAILLKDGGYRVFYDEDELADLWGKNLYDFLSSVYKDHARYCVVFLSKHYEAKLWTNHERQQAQAKAFKENREYILPVRLDDTEIQGIPQTIGYLDLRLMNIEEVYNALEYKLSGTIPNTVGTEQGSTSSVEGNTIEYVLLNSQDGKLYFIPVQKSQWDSTEISLELMPESPEDTAFLRTLRDNISNLFARSTFIALALGEEAEWVIPKEIGQTSSKSQNVWTVKFNVDRHRKNGNPFGEITFGSLTPDDIAEMRAKRILLNEKLGELPQDIQNLSGSVGVLNEASLEVFVRGGNGFQISASAIPTLHQYVGKTGRRFEKFARLISVLHLKLSNTIEKIHTLDLKLLNSEQLAVKFNGSRPKRYVNQEPTIIEFEGICQLTE